MPKFDDRFARQNRCELPPEFPLASPYSGIVHHLSGPSINVLTQNYQMNLSSSVDGADCSSHLSLSLRAWVFHPNTHIYARLLGPCFKTGRLKPIRQHPRHVYRCSQKHVSQSSVTHSVAVSWFNTPPERKATSQLTLFWTHNWCWPSTPKVHHCRQ